MKVSAWEVLRLDHDTVEHVEPVDDEHTKSMAGGIAKGIVGGALFGGVGAVAGAMSAKKRIIHDCSEIQRWNGITVEC